MIPKIRVLVVDDDAVSRKILSRAFDGDPDAEVVATAATGRIALNKLEQFSPDLVTLDIVMPDMDGLEVLFEIRKRKPQLPVIMVSSLAEEGAAETVEALSMGASDYLLKPSTRGIDETIAALRGSLLDKVKALCGRSTNKSILAPEPSVTTPAGRVRHGDIRVLPPSIVVIGVSTGGPQALAQELPKLPSDFPAAILVVQHMPASFTPRLTERLAQMCRIPVREAVAGAKVEPNSIWIAPGDQHLFVKGTSDRALLALSKDPPENSCRPAADVLFRSAASVFGSSVLALVLTGMGQDGLRGSEAIASAGGRIWVQDRLSSVVWGMPGSVARAGLAERELPLDRIGSALSELMGTASSASSASSSAPSPAPVSSPDGSIHGD